MSKEINLNYTNWILHEVNIFRELQNGAEGRKLLKDKEKKYKKQLEAQCKNLCIGGVPKRDLWGLGQNQ